MRTIVSLVIDHKKPIPELANLIAQRAYTIDGVDDAEPVVVTLDWPDLIRLPVVEMPEVKA